MTRKGYPRKHYRPRGCAFEGYPPYRRYLVACGDGVDGYLTVTTWKETTCLRCLPHRKRQAKGGSA